MLWLYNHLVFGLDVGDRADRHAQVRDDPVLEAVDPAVQLHRWPRRQASWTMVVRAMLRTCSTTFSSHSRSTRAVVVGNRPQLLLVIALHVLHVPQPVVDQAVRLALHRRPHAAAAVMPADDHVLDLQHVDRELQHRQAVEVGVHDHVGDVAVHEQLARIEADDLVRRDAAVGAADPQELRGLLFLEPGEEGRVAPDTRHAPRRGSFRAASAD